MRPLPHAPEPPNPVADFATRAVLPLDWLTWAGFAVAAAGWGVLITAVAFGETLLKGGNLVALLSARSDVVTLAQAAIASGLGLAVVGALRTGFGALNGFFAAVLHRSTAPKPVPVASVEPLADDDPEPAVAPIVPARERFAPAGPRDRPHNYRIRPDGAVEVETLLGTRVFATLEEARDFIH